MEDFPRFDLGVRTALVPRASRGLGRAIVAPTFIRTPGTADALLASPAASLITGHSLLIDGGWTA